MNTYDVFISYIHGQAIANKMKNALERLGLSVFIDTNLSMGSPLVASINAALKEAKSYLLIIDKDFITHQWTQAETQASFLEAMNSKRLFPLLVDNEARDYWVSQNPLYANILGRIWNELNVESLASEIYNVILQL